MRVDIELPIPRLKGGQSNSKICRSNSNLYSNPSNRYSNRNGSSDSDTWFSEYNRSSKFVQKMSPSMHWVEKLHRSAEVEGKVTMRTNRESKLIQNVQNSIIGEGHVFESPFGRRRCLYLDQTASGRCVNTIEDFIQENVMPVYANTHSTTSYCASQISAYREEAREFVKKYCGCGKDDEVIFCGSGATSAVHKLVNSLLKQGDPPPIVILGPYEHHSNILPWREITPDVYTIGEDPCGFVNLKELKTVLESAEKNALKSGRQIIGSFSAGSNVTGALTDDVAVSKMLHKYGALSFWDYAAAAPHLKIEMNPECCKFASKDAIFFSGHKFLGGPQTPGVLVVKKHVLRSQVPHGHGGGTVLFVTKGSHQYLEDIVERNEGGTPDIIGSIRLGLVLQMQSSVGISNVIQREAHFTKRTLEEWGEVKEILVLGHQHSIRLPIVSFMIKHLETGHFLHQDFVVALLNDLFGVQCRSGCMCAGPYGQGLLGTGEELATEYKYILSQPRTKVYNGDKPEVDMIFKPGFIRMSLPYHASYDEIDFAINAVKFIAKNGWKLLPFYKMDVVRGIFRFNGTGAMNQRKTIKSFSLNTNLELNLNLMFSEMDSHPGNEECLNFAFQLVESVEEVLPEYELDLDLVDDTSLFARDRLPLRWFLLPSEAIQLMKNPGYISKYNVCPFQPKQDYKIPEGKYKYASNSEGSVPSNMDNILRDTNSRSVKEKQLHITGKRSTSLIKLIQKFSR